MNVLDAVMKVVNFVGKGLNGGKPFSRKLVAAEVTFALTWVVSFAVAHGVHAPSFVAAVIPAAVGLAASAVAGWLAKEDPALFSAKAKK